MALHTNWACGTSSIAYSNKIEGQAIETIIKKGIIVHAHSNKGTESITSRGLRGNGFLYARTIATISIIPTKVIINIKRPKISL